MIIAVNDLDRGIKDQLSSSITTGLFKKYSTLPTEQEKISDLVSTASVKEDLDNQVKQYYREVAERDVSVNISTGDYVKVYMKQV